MRLYPLEEYPDIFTGRFPKHVKNVAIVAKKIGRIYSNRQREVWWKVLGDLCNQHDINPITMERILKGT